MKLMYRLFALVGAGVLAMCSLTACGGKDEEAEKAAKLQAQKVAELKQNDYRGGLKRAGAIQTVTLNVIKEMKGANENVRKDNPDSYWNMKDFEEFVADFLTPDIIADTQWFNEEETDWETVLKTISTSKNSFTKKVDGAYSLQDEVKIQRIEKNEYEISGVPSKYESYSPVTKEWKTISSTETYYIMYDSDKDWCKAYVVTPIGTSANGIVGEPVTSMFEYARLDADTFIMQTSRERFYIKFEPVVRKVNEETNQLEADTPIDKRVIKEFYYSKLMRNGTRSKYQPYQPLPEKDLYTDTELFENKRKNEDFRNYSFMNDEDDLRSFYGRKETIFKGSLSDMQKALTPEWVFEDTSIQAALAYRTNNDLTTNAENKMDKLEECLAVTVWNKLTELYESYTYKRNSTTDAWVKDTEKFIEKKNFGGEVVLKPEEVAPETTAPAAPAETTTTTTTTEAVETDADGNPVTKPEDTETTETTGEGGEA